MARGKYLDGKGGDDALRMNQRGLAEVVETAISEDLCARLEPHRLPEGCLVPLQQL